MSQNKIPLLRPDDIEVKIKQVTKAGALALLYKTSRVDRKILNAVYGSLNWTSDYKVVKENLYCGIGVRENPDSEFVWKWDCGVESRADEQGNEKKGEASDSFKRAGFQWGIGEELYSAPFIWLNVATKQNNAGKWELVDPFAKYYINDIQYDEEERRITFLSIINAKGVEVFAWSKNKPKKAQPANNEAKTKTAAVATDNKANDKPDLATLKSYIGRIAKNMFNAEGNTNAYKDTILAVTNDASFKCNTATEDQYDLVYNILEALHAKGYKE